MTLNTEFLHTTTAKVNTQVASYFDIVDQSVLMSDTNKRYTINPQSSYSPSAPISARSYTTVIISPNSDNTADLYNGFITSRMEVKIRLEGLPDKMTSIKSLYFKQQPRKFISLITYGSDLKMLWTLLRNNG